MTKYNCVVWYPLSQACKSNKSWLSQFCWYSDWVPCCQTDLWDILSNTPKGLQCLSKLALGWLWILRISGWLWLVHFMIEIFVCGVSVAASRQPEIGFQQNQESHNLSGRIEKETKTYQNFQICFLVSSDPSDKILKHNCPWSPFKCRPAKLTLLWLVNQ